MLCVVKKIKEPANALFIERCGLFFNGSPSWTRTSDILINSQTLYQLSYRGI